MQVLQDEDWRAQHIKRGMPLPKVDTKSWNIYRKLSLEEFKQMILGLHRNGGYQAPTLGGRCGCIVVDRTQVEGGTALYLSLHGPVLYCSIL